MNEIELKARVHDRESLIKRLDSFAVFEKSVARDDVYYGTAENPAARLRIRKESCGDTSRYILTYKRKEKKEASGSISTELNEELECTLSDSEPLERFLTDTGYRITLKKHKEVQDWTVSIPETVDGKTLSASLELCNVPPLGDFLEIEVLSPSKNEDDVKRIQDRLLVLLDECGIDRACIEDRYYSELLAGLNGQ